uniref:DUF4926 domain-containing protein n=1 Tax=Trichocoleus desertorum TaxID=1481672 RepID=UPI0025B5574B|nr:DUF4926 domain-containing protein [Trichocoleus desertorum]
MKTPTLLDTVATLRPVSSDRLILAEPSYASIASLPPGQVGTVVERYEEVEQTQYLVEFADLQGREYFIAVLQADELLVLHYELSVA